MLSLIFESPDGCYNGYRRCHNKQNRDMTGYSSGSNGQAWKFLDGTLICAKQVTYEGSCSTAWGNGYETPSISLGNWQTPFVGTPIVLASVQQSAAGIIERVQGVTSTSAGTTSLYRPASATGTWTICVVGFGRWK